MWGGPGDVGALNVWNCDIGATTLDATLAAAIGDAIDQAFLDNLPAYFASSFIPVGFTVTDLRTTNGPQYAVPMTFIGTSVSNPMPRQNAQVVKWHTATRGRSFTGRTWLPGWAENASDGDNLSTAAQAALSGWAQDMLTNLSAANADLAIVSRYHQVVPGTPPTVPRVTNLITPVTSGVLDLYWHTLRSRSLKG